MPGDAKTTRKAAIRTLAEVTVFAMVTAPLALCLVFRSTTPAFVYVLYAAVAAFHAAWSATETVWNAIEALIPTTEDVPDA